ncbi:hypothetical protein C8R44DRAFT_757598, partial [Mycena epipterygia]
MASQCPVIGSLAAWMIRWAAVKPPSSSISGKLSLGTSRYVTHGFDRPVDLGTECVLQVYWTESTVFNFARTQRRH